MVLCAAYGCSARSDRKNKHINENTINISFHAFPKDENIRKQWINAVGRKDWLPNQNSKLCSQHFEEGSYISIRRNFKLLHKDAVPTIFQSEVQQPRIGVRRIIKKKLSPLRTLIAPYLPNLELDFTSASDSTINHVTFTSPLTSSNTPAPSKSNPIVPIPSTSSLFPKYISRITSFSPKRKRKLESRNAVQIRNLMEKELNAHRKKKCTFQQTKRRRKSRTATMRNVISSLKNNNMLSDQYLNLLNYMSDSHGEILKRPTLKNNNCLPKVYNPELRKFALTLHYYSPRAYEHVRQTFNTCLPHPKTLSSWYKSMDGKPGFTSESFTAIENMVGKTGNPLFCTLLLDEMSIRKHLDFSKAGTVGYVDIGTGLEGDIRPLAKDALVFMLVCINGSWKIPVGYFFVDGVSGEQRANLVYQCLTLSHEAGIRIIALTCDGTPSNLTMMSKLGCQLNPRKGLITYFEHPTTKLNVYVFLDPSHMIKLAQNTLCEKGIIYDEDGKVISWHYFEKLNKIQQNEDLHLGNKLRNLHINFSRQKMKVMLATQLFSKSVADSLRFSSEVLKLNDFEGCEPTIKFCRIFDRLFDILNSKSMKQLGHKKPFNENNYVETSSFLREVESYIMGLKINCKGDLLIESSWKTGFIGFLISINSLKNMYIELCKRNKYLIYIPLYKISQDHLKLFFALIRARGGSNNNPTCVQFVSAYKKNLVDMEVSFIKSGNCLPLEGITVLSAEKKINLTTPGFREEYHEESVQESENHIYNNIDELSMSQNIITYIAGFVVRHLEKHLKCEACSSAVLAVEQAFSSHYNLINIKNKGGLLYPSSDVLNVCQITEKYLRQTLIQSDGRYQLTKFSSLILSSKVLKHYLNKNIFINLTEHSFNQAPMDNHIHLLVKAIAEKYIDVRLNHIARNMVDPLESKRQIFNKLILFQGT